MYSNLDDQPLGVETQTGMPESIRARLARFSEEHAAKAVIAPVEQHIVHARRWRLCDTKCKCGLKRSRRICRVTEP